MGTFLSDLTRKLEKAAGHALPWGDINPLVVIGLSEAVLDLGFTEDQMYQVVRTYSRQVAAQVHPDRQPENVSPERQKQILEAFDMLDNRENFSRALADFKTLRAEDRRETKILSQSLSALRAQISGFEANFNSLQDGKKKLVEDRQEFEKQKREDPLAVPALQKEIECFKVEVRRNHESINQHFSGLKKWKRQFESLAQYFISLGDQTGKDQLGIHAFEARWVAVVSLWPPDAPDPSPLDESGSVRPEVFEETLALVKDERIANSVFDSWRSILPEIGISGKLENKVLPLGFSLVALDAGNPRVVIGHRFAGFGGRIIGCLPPDKIPLKRSNLRYQTSQDTVFETIHPFLVPSGILVSLRKDSKKSRRASWSTTCPAFHLTSKRIILAVG